MSKKKKNEALEFLLDNSNNKNRKRRKKGYRDYAKAAWRAGLRP